MRILFISVFFKPHIGGAEKFAEELLSHIHIQHPEVKIDVVCYNTDNASQFENTNHFQVYRVKCLNILDGQFSLANPFDLLRTLFKLRSQKYTHVISQTRFFDPAWWSWLYARLIHAKSIFIEHGSDFAHHQNRLIKLSAKLIDLTISRFSLNQYDKVLTISNATDKFIRERLKIKNSTVIYPGIETKPAVITTTPNWASLLATKNNKIILTFIGRLIIAKGVIELLAAFKKVNSADHLLIIAGKGPLASVISEETRKDPRIIYLGEVDPIYIPLLLSKTHIFINPSHNEGLSRTVLEACLAGTSIIATNVGATNEIISHHKNGILIPPCDIEALVSAILTLVENPKLRKEYGKNTKRQVLNEFDWQKNAEKYYNEIEMLQ